MDESQKVLNTTAERLHKHFENEVTALIQSYYAGKSINNIASGNEDIYHGLHDSAICWNIILHSLQTTFFITLGRIFDTDPKVFSIHSYLRSYIKSPEWFTQDALRVRKGWPKREYEPAWIQEYLDNAYYPKLEDFLKYKQMVKPYQERYESIYKPIRHNIMAHKNFEMIDSLNDLFKGTNIGIIEDTILFLYQLHSSIFDLIYNGKKNELSHYKFSEDERVDTDMAKILSHFNINRLSENGADSKDPDGYEAY